jgi:CRP-like cAMP-binding protein
VWFADGVFIHMILPLSPEDIVMSNGDAGLNEMQSDHVTYEDGAVIFEKGSIGKEIYIIRKGKVEVSSHIRGRKIPIAMLEKGDFLGEMAVFTDVRRSGTATAIGKVELTSFTMEEILLNRQLTVDLLQTLASRLRNTTSTLGNAIASMIDFLPKPG